MKIEPKNIEQQLCVSCGFCCDGTLFSRARTRDEYHPLFNYEDADGHKSFKLPCHLFKDGCCSIYGQKRPSVCGEFRCKLLRRVDAGHISQTDAENRILQALKLKQEILDELKSLNHDVSLGLQQSLQQFRELELEKLSEIEFNKKFARLLVKHQLLTEYLKKHFKGSSKKKKANIDS